MCRRRKRKSSRAEARDPQKNQGTGTRVARRLRAQGRVPAIVYGHKKDPQPVSLTASTLVGGSSSTKRLGSTLVQRP